MFINLVFWCACTGEVVKRMLHCVLIRTRGKLFHGRNTSENSKDVFNHRTQLGADRVASVCVSVSWHKDVNSGRWRRADFNGELQLSAFEP
jgi:hypothetical protein